MADRESARVFGDIFRLLAKTPDERNKELAARILKLTDRFDFSQYQMEADGELEDLGLLKRCATCGGYLRYEEDHGPLICSPPEDKP